MLGYAVERGILSGTPVRDVDLKRLAYKPVPDKSGEVFSEDEAEKLLMYLETLDDDPYALAIRLDFNLFVRIGEIEGLMWECVHAKRQTDRDADIQQAVKEVL